MSREVSGEELEMEDEVSEMSEDESEDARTKSSRKSRSKGKRANASLMLKGGISAPGLKIEGEGVKKQDS